MWGVFVLFSTGIKRLRNKYAGKFYIPVLFSEIEINFAVQPTTKTISVYEHGRFF